MGGLPPVICPSPPIQYKVTILPRHSAYYWQQQPAIVLSNTAPALMVHHTNVLEAEHFLRISEMTVE